MAALSPSSLCGLVCKGFGSYQIHLISHFYSRWQHWTENASTQSHLQRLRNCFKQTVAGWRCQQLCMFTKVKGVSYFSTDYFVRGGMYTFYSSNILYIMFILCDEYARRYTTHWAESETLLMWSAVDAWWLWCPVRHRWGRRQKHTTLLLGLRGSAHLSYIPDLQGHWDTVFKYKDNFLKAFQFCALKPFCKDDL